jgi:hypothetical protein
MIETYLKLSSSEEVEILCIGQTEQNGFYTKGLEEEWVAGRIYETSSKKSQSMIIEHSLHLPSC